MWPFKPPHRHKWVNEKMNRWGIVFERSCACGHVEHTTWDGFDWDTCTTRWTPGPAEPEAPKDHFCTEIAQAQTKENPPKRVFSPARG